MDKIDAIITSVLTAITIGLFAFILGKKKTDIEIALNYQSYYDKFLSTLKKEVAELQKENKEQKKIIESQKENIRRWETNCEKLDLMLKEERKEYQKLLKQIK